MLSARFTVRVLDAPSLLISYFLLALISLPSLYHFTTAVSGVTEVVRVMLSCSCTTRGSFWTNSFPNLASGSGKDIETGKLITSQILKDSSLQFPRLTIAYQLHNLLEHRNMANTTFCWVGRKTMIHQEPIFYSFYSLSLGLFISYNALPQNWAVLEHTAAEGIVLITFLPVSLSALQNFPCLLSAPGHWNRSGDEVCKDKQNLYSISLVKNIPRPDFHLAITTLKRRI